MKISLARALGTCFGVQDAIDAALDPSFRGNLTIVGQLVHNPQVVEELRQNGVRLVDSADDEITTPNVMITAHGAARSMKGRASSAERSRATVKGVKPSAPSSSCSACQTGRSSRHPHQDAWAMSRTFLPRCCDRL